MTMSCQTELVQIHLTSYLISQQMNLKCNSHKCNISKSFSINMNKIFFSLQLMHSKQCHSVIIKNTGNNNGKKSRPVLSKYALKNLHMSRGVVLWNLQVMLPMKCRTQITMNLFFLVCWSVLACPFINLYKLNTCIHQISQMYMTKWQKLELNGH